MPGVTTAGWRVPARLAVRDLRRYTGRSMLASLLIAVPLFLIAGLLGAYSTLVMDDAERSALTFSKAEAKVRFNLVGLVGYIDPSHKLRDVPAAPLPGASGPPSKEHLPTLAQVEAFSGGRASMSSTRMVSMTPRDDGRPAGTTVAGTYERVTGDATLWRSPLHLDSGRWPTSDTEVLVTRYGRGAGLPSSGEVRVRADGTNRTLNIVGVVSSHSSSTLIGSAGLPGLVDPTFLLSHNRADADAWADHGAELTTATYDGRLSEPPDLARNAAIAVGVMLLIGVVALLAGPAFAASAARQRRSLGIVASNGGERFVMRRIVVLQALLIGVTSALVAVTLGGPLGALVMLEMPRIWPGLDPGPFQVPWRWLLGLVLVAAVASLVTALVPAVMAGRTNLLAVLRGQVSPRRVRRSMPTVGVVLVVLGIALLSWTASDVTNQRGMGIPQIVIGVPLFFIGGVRVIPGTLSLWGRAAEHLPLTLRIAVRDVSRNRTRATAAVGSVLALATAFSTIAIFADSMDEHDGRIYSYSAPVGSARLQMPALRGGVDEARRRIDTAVPGAQIARIHRVGSDTGVLFDHSDAQGNQPASTSLTEAFFGAVGCMPAALSHSLGDQSGELSVFTPASVLAVDSSGEYFAHLSTSQRSTLERGGALVITDGGRARRANDSTPRVPVSGIRDGHLTMSTVTASGIRLDATTFGATKVSCRTGSVPAESVAVSAFSHMPEFTDGAVVVLTSTTRSHGLPMTDGGVFVSKPGGLSDADASALDSVVDPQWGSVWVERGYRSHVMIVLLIALGVVGLLSVLAAVISTLLSAAESGAEAATMAAVGAPTGMRRRIVAAHAGAIAFIGVLTGYLLGMGPGVVLAVTNTSKNNNDSTLVAPIVNVPWGVLGALLIVVPLIAAAIVALGAPKAPTMTRRDA